jgi:hypothetical protein
MKGQRQRQPGNASSGDQYPIVGHSILLFFFIVPVNCSSRSGEGIRKARPFKLLSVKPQLVSN